MKKNQKILILFIIIVFIIILIITSALTLVSKKNDKEENNISTQVTNDVENIFIEQENDSEFPKQEIEIDNKIKYVNDRTMYFTITALYDNYINLIGYQNKEDLKNVLSQVYISEYKITDNNIFSKLTIPKTENDYQYYKSTISEILTAQIDDTTHIYIVKGNCRIVGKDTKFSVQAMFEVDTVNNIYNVYPYQYMKDNGYDKLSIGVMFDNYKKEEIINREDNEFKYITKTDLEMAEEYFNNYRELLQYHTDGAYNKLDTEYAKRRFGSKENYQIYLKENKSTIDLMSINTYKVNSYKNYTDYICSDKYNNIYIFRQQDGIMRYSVFLDNYTVMTDEDVEYYNKLEEFDKAKYNLSKFIKQVNTKDYTAIYNSLDKTFRSNNFKTQDDLKKYLKNNLYNNNSIEIKDVDNETYEYYVFECRVTNLRNSSESKNITIIINQQEGTDYTMSFNAE